MFFEATDLHRAVFFNLFLYRESTIHCRQGLAAGGGGKKTEGGAQNQKEVPHFKNTVLDVCSNQGAKREMGGHRF